MIADGESVPRNVVIHRHLSEHAYDLKTAHTVHGRSLDVSCVNEDFSILVESLSETDDWMFNTVEESDISDMLMKTYVDVMTHDFPVVPTKQLQGEISKSMSMNIKVALNSEVRQLPRSPNCLIVGSGYGNDVRRILRAYEKRGGYGNIRFVLVEPDNDRRLQSELENRSDETKNIVVEHIAGKLDEVWPQVVAAGPFDIILATMSVQHLIGRDNDSVCNFSALLTTSGVLLGTHFDHDSYFANMVRILDEVGPILSVAPRSPLSGTRMGAHLTRLYTTRFLDPYVSGALVGDFALSNNLDYHYFRGVHAAEFYGERSLGRTAKSKSIMATVSSLVVLRRMSMVHYPLMTTKQWVFDKFPKARVVARSELHHFRVGQFAVAPKLDGVCEYWFLDSRGLVTPDNHFPNCPSFPQPLCVQIEKAKGKVYAVDIFLQEWLVKPVPFLQRLRLLESVSLLLFSYGLDAINDFVVPAHSDDIMMLQFSMSRHEGIVIIPLTPYWTKGFSEVRYAKWVLTCDKEVSKGVVVEFEAVPGKPDAVGAPLRPREDKKVGNPKSTLNEIASAPSLSEVFSSLHSAASNAPLPQYLEPLLKASDVFAKASTHDILSIIKYRSGLTMDQQEFLSTVLGEGVMKCYRDEVPTDKAAVYGSELESVSDYDIDSMFE